QLFTDAVSLPVVEKPGWLGPRQERPAHDRLVDALEHVRVVHPPEPALDVFQGRAGMAAPGWRHQTVAHRRPVVDRDRAVPELDDCTVQRLAHRAILLVSRVNDDARVERAPQPVVAESRRLAQNPDRIRARDRGLREDPAEGLDLEQLLVAIGRLEPGHERPRQLALGRLSELLDAPAPAQKLLVAVL